MLVVVRILALDAETFPLVGDTRRLLQVLVKGREARGHVRRMEVALHTGLSRKPRIRNPILKP